MYVPDILHDTWVTYKFLTIATACPGIDLGANTTKRVSKAGDIVGNDICLLMSAEWWI